MLTAFHSPLFARAGKLTALACVLAAVASVGIAQLHSASAQWTITTVLPAKVAAAPLPSTPTQATVKSAPAPVPNCASVAFGTPSQLSLSDAADGLSVQADQPVSYRIYGNTAADLRAQIQRCAPGNGGSAGAEFTGQTDYALGWQYAVMNMGDSCSLADVKVGLHTAIAVPYWQPTAGAVSGLAGRWQAFSSGLLTHEQGHVAIDKSYATKLAADLSALTDVPCNGIASTASAVAATDTSALQQANDAYDASTNHGATQGATLPTF